jgi:hypothetical protein
MNKKRRPVAGPVNRKFTIKGGLTRQHKLLIDDLFERGLSESQVCEKHGLAMDKLREWCQDDDFRAEVRDRLFTPVSKAWIMLARSATRVAARLIELTESQKEETARKACLDILTALPLWQADVCDDGEELSLPPGVSEKTASRILEVLAEEEGQLDEDAKSEPEIPGGKLSPSGATNPSR